jgi:thiamine biosynthesis lipoprotein
MGTSWSVKATLPADTRYDKIQTGLEIQLAQLNGALSNWVDTSDITLLNALSSPGCVPARAHTANVIAKSLSLSAKTQGAFDITVSPLIRLWGFGEDLIWDNVPSDKDIQAKLANIGYGHVSLSEDRSELCKAKADLEVNVSAIGKGYAVDVLAEYLMEQGITDFLVEIGGELFGQGKNGAGRPWQIGVENPSEISRQVYDNTVVVLKNAGMATSGDYRNYFERDGVRYSHTIDPTTGKPITHNLASVTVVASSSMEADALATAMMVMGGDAALAYAEENNVAVLLLLRDGQGFDMQYSSLMRHHLVKLQ